MPQKQSDQPALSSRRLSPTATLNKRWTWNALLSLGVTLLLALFMIIPVIMSAMAGVTENYFKGISSGLTLRWLGEVWSLYRGSIVLSLYIAISAVIVNIIVGLPCAYYWVRYPSTWTRIMDSFVTLPIAIPGVAIALGMLSVYAGIGAFRTSWLFILAGHVLFTLPFMIKSIMAVMQSINLRELEEASKSLGAGFWQGFFKVIVPNCKGGILSGVLMTLTLSIGEFNLTWMLHTPMTKTLPVGLADSYASMRLEISSAYTLFFLLMVLPLLLLAQFIGNYHQRHDKHSR